MLGEPHVPSLLRHMSRMGHLKRRAQADIGRLPLLRIRSREFYAERWHQARNAQEAAVCVYLERRDARARAARRIASANDNGVRS